MARSVPASTEKKPAIWVGSSLRDLKQFPAAVQEELGFALSVAQHGEKHGNAKPWKGLGPGVLEIVEDNASETYRAVYIANFAEVMYVLHAFHKKATHGIKTPKRHVDLISARFREAVSHYKEHYEKQNKHNADQ